jgi:hypothetical protein
MDHIGILMGIKEMIAIEWGIYSSPRCHESELRKTSYLNGSQNWGVRSP